MALAPRNLIHIALARSTLAKNACTQGEYGNVWSKRISTMRKGTREIRESRNIWREMLEKILLEKYGLECLYLAECLRKYSDCSKLKYRKSSEQYGIIGPQSPS